MKRFILKNPSLGTYAPRKFNPKNMADIGEVIIFCAWYHKSLIKQKTRSSSATYQVAQTHTMNSTAVVSCRHHLYKASVGTKGYNHSHLYIHYSSNCGINLLQISDKGEKQKKCLVMRETVFSIEVRKRLNSGKKCMYYQRSYNFHFSNLCSSIRNQRW